VATRWSEGGEDAHAKLARECRLAYQEQCKWGFGVHLGIREQAQFFELIWREQVGLVDDEHDARSTLVFFGGQQALHMSYQCSWKPRGTALF